MAEILFQITLAFFASALAALFAIYIYFRQREHELIQTRYLEGAIDLLAAETDRIAETFSHNWARCLGILKSYRDMENQFDPNELTRGFLNIHSSRHNIVAHHRLHKLTGTMDYWDYYQHVMSYYTRANSILVHEICDVIRSKLNSNDSINASHNQIVEDGFKIAKEQDDGSHRFIQLAAELQVLSSEFETEKYQFKNLHKFKEKPEVKASIERMSILLKTLED